MAENEIRLEDLTESDVGRWVEYHTQHDGTIERGRIKSWNLKYIFVVYNCADNWSQFKDYTAAATNPSDLRFAT